MQRFWAVAVDLRKVGMVEARAEAPCVMRGEAEHDLMVGHAYPRPLEVSCWDASRVDLLHLSILAALQQAMMEIAESERKRG